MQFIRSEYLKEFDNFKKNYVKKFAVMLVLFCIIGFVVHLGLGRLIKQNTDALKGVFEYLNESVDMTVGESELSTAGFAMRLFVHNARASLIVVLIGFIPFLYLPVLGYALNAGLIGVISSILMATGRFSTAYFFAGILPHGILEIPALIYGAVIGIHACKSLAAYILKKKEVNVNDVMTNALRGYVIVIIPMLFVAAFLESFLTPWVMGFFM